jgi:hypothetical protein
MADREIAQPTIQVKRKLLNTAKLEIQITLLNNKLYIRDVGYRFFKTLDATYISRRQKENKIQVPY